MDLNDQQISGLIVRVENVMYVPHLDTPKDKSFAFVYFITVKNNAKVTVTIKGRKWVVREADGECTVVEGAGVVGETPTIEPGGEFTYNSYHVVQHESEVQGALFGTTESGGLFSVRIPDFKLRIPFSGA
ncbi:MAG: ApaG domain [Rubritalea sp.]|uniref:ApaG domain-containing protein n=1 Tax=Rubritalea sp. TaxID=2109375 RepID=UPI00324257D9